MSDQMLLATRKGLLKLACGNGEWSLTGTDFAGIPVTAVLRDPRDDAIYAMLKHGHFGSKLHRSYDGCKSWIEIAAPAFPPDAAGEPSLFQVWTLEAGGPSQPGRLWAGAIPAGLFVSNTCGASWQLVRALWDVPERANGSAAAMTTPASIRSWSTRATRGACSSAFPAAAYGKPATMARASACKARA